MKKYAGFILLMGITISAYADDTTNQFALQAGNIAGAAEQCGQDASVLISRSKEAIKVMAPNAVDQSDADSLFDKSVANARSLQSSVIRKFSCQDVLTTYNSLPLLRSDYEQSVIAVLAAHRSSVVQTNSAPSATSAATPAPSPTVSQQIVQPTDQPSQDQSPIQQAIQNEMDVSTNAEQQYVSADDNAYNNTMKKNYPNKNTQNNTVNNNVQNTPVNNNVPFNSLPPSDIISTNQQNVYMANPDAPINPPQ